MTDRLKPQPRSHQRPYNHRAKPDRSPASPPLILAIYTLLALALTYPLLFNLADTAPNDIGDPLLNAWILAWDSHALLAHPLDLFNANIFYPLPNTLAYSEHLFSTALLALPLQLVSAEPVVAYNLSLLLTFPLAAFGMYLLALRWTRQAGAAFIAGLIFAFAPYRFAAIAHLQLLTFQWLPLALLFLDKLIAAGPGRRRRLQTGLLICLLLQLLASWYLASYTLLILAIYLAVLLLSRSATLTSLKSLALPFLIAGLATLIFARPYLALIDSLRQARPLSLALSLAAQTTDYLAAAPFNRLFGPLTASFRDRPGFTEENTLFPGLVAPLLALIPILALLTGFITRGRSQKTPPAPRRGKAALPSGGPGGSLIIALLLILLLSLALSFPGPYAALARLLPAATVIRVPARWLIPALFALAGLAAVGFAAINRQVAAGSFFPARLKPLASSLLLLTCAGLLLLESISSPIPLAAVENRTTLNPAYRWLAENFQPGQIALVELPLHSAPAPEYPEVKRLYASTLGWWQLVNGYSGYTPPRQPLLAQDLSPFPAPPAIAALQQLTMNNKQSTNTSYPKIQAEDLLQENPKSTQSWPDYAREIHNPKSLYLLVHPGEAPFDRSQWETAGRWQAERNPALQPIGRFDGDYLYRVIPPDPDRFSGPPLAIFGQQEQAIQLLAAAVSPPAFNGQPPRLSLFWQPTAPLAAAYTLFIHLRAADGFVRGQADSPPVSNQYPTTAWQSGEIIQDIHPLPAETFSQANHLAIGLYDPATGERLPAFGPAGDPLPDNALIIPLK